MNQQIKTFTFTKKDQINSNLIILFHFLNFAMNECKNNKILSPLKYLEKKLNTFLQDNIKK